MDAAAELAGFFTAHAIWCVAEGETLVPIYAYADGSEKPTMERLLHNKLEEGVEAGRRRLEETSPGIDAKVLIFDGRITLSGTKMDALIVEFRSYASPPGKVIVAIPYTPHQGRQRFAVHRPKVLETSEHLRDAVAEVFEFFFEGVRRHEQGSALWNDHLDESK